MIPASAFPNIEAQLLAKGVDPTGDVRLDIQTHGRAVARRALKPIIAAINGNLIRVSGVSVETADSKVRRVTIDFD